jgi:hypothetical protein
MREDERMTNPRGAAAPAYDGRETGPRYHVTTQVNDETVSFQHRVDDPFVRQTVHVARRDMLRSLLRWRRLTVVVIVGGDRDAVEGVLSLDGDYRSRAS